MMTSCLETKSGQKTSTLDRMVRRSIFLGLYRTAKMVALVTGSETNIAMLLATIPNVILMGAIASMLLRIPIAGGEEVRNGLHPLHPLTNLLETTLQTQVSLGSFLSSPLLW